LPVEEKSVSAVEVSTVPFAATRAMTRLIALPVEPVIAAVPTAAS